MKQYNLQQQHRATRPPARQVKREQEDEDELYDDEYDDNWPPRMPNSSLRYYERGDVRTEMGRTRPDVRAITGERAIRATNPGEMPGVPPRRSATQASIPAVQANRRRSMPVDEVPVRQREQVTEDISKPRFHWLVFVGMALFIMVVGWVLLTTIANWWQVTQDDWHYGRPRTYQVDMVVGHNDSPAHPSHFIAINLDSHIEVIEFPGGDPSKAKVYVGPTLIGPNSNLAVVTLTFKDVNGDGKLDMIINVQGSHFVFINDNGAFRPARPSDNVQL